MKGMEKFGIEKAVLLAMDIGPPKMFNGVLEDRLFSTFRLTNIENISKLVIEAKRFLEFAHTPNEVVYSFIREFPEKFIGFGSISPVRRKSEILSLLKKFENYNFKGFKTIPTLQQYDPKKNDNIDLIWKKCEDKNYIIMAHTGFDPGPWEYFPLSIMARPSRYENLIKKYDAPVILAHAGSYSAYYPKIWLNEAMDLVRRYEHVYMDISAVFYLVQDEETVNSWRELAIMDKVLYGSDYPAVDGFGLGEPIQIIRESKNLDKKEKEMILRLNAEKLLQTL